jgi:cell division protein FtsB
MKPFFSNSKKAFAVVGLIILAYLLLDLNHRVDNYFQLSSERVVVRTQVSLLQATEQSLQTQIAYANSDAAVEKWAREDAFMARPGDHPIIMLPDPNYQPTPTPVPTKQSVETENWEIWAVLFFGK